MDIERNESEMARYLACKIRHLLAHIVERDDFELEGLMPPLSDALAKINKEVTELTQKVRICLCRHEEIYQKGCPHIHRLNVAPLCSQEKDEILTRRGGVV